MATSIVLQNFAVWAGYREHVRQDAKFVVAERPLRTHSRGDAVNAVPLLPRRGLTTMSSLQPWWPESRPGLHGHHVCDASVCLPCLQLTGMYLSSTAFQHT